MLLLPPSSAVGSGTIVRSYSVTRSAVSYSASSADGRISEIRGAVSPGRLEDKRERGTVAELAMTGRPSAEQQSDGLLVDAHRREVLALLLDLRPALLQELGHLGRDTSIVQGNQETVRTQSSGEWGGGRSPAARPAAP